MNLRTTVCKCGYEFGTKDIKPPFTVPEAGFYGGRVKKFSKAVCGCGKAYTLYLKPIRQSWEVIDVEPIEPEPIEYADMTNAQLIEILKEQGKEVPNRANKTQLIELLG